ncbi:MAG: hypothetical protein HYU39_09290 [Thaumarchaeota archaeon]|nr:hypothetical protein [Nitrososphaerota archaeon]
MSPSFQEALLDRGGGYGFTHSEGSHDDLAVALALACWSVRTGRGEIVRIQF